MMTTHSKGKANVSGPPSEASNVDGLCKIAKSCNVCGKECAKHCSRCRLVFYCSVNCQHQDWKRHKKECKIVPKKKEDIGPTLASLPDDLLVQIGKWVAKICNVRSYQALAMTSKSFHSLLMDDTTVSTVIETESFRVMDRFSKNERDSHGANASGYLLFGFPESFQELHLWKTALELMSERSNKFYFPIVDVARAAFIIRSICGVMTLNRSAIVILDAHCGSDAPLEQSRETSYTSGMFIGLNLARAFANLGGSKAVESMKSRVFIRNWGATARESAIAMQDAHAKRVAEGSGWVEVSFRIKLKEIVEFPPRSRLYEDLYFPEEIAYSELHDGLIRANAGDFNRYGQARIADWLTDLLFEEF